MPCCAGYGGKEDDFGSGVAENDAEFVFGRANILLAQYHLRKRGQEALVLDPVAQGIRQKKQKPVGPSISVKAMAAAGVQPRPPQ
jgi:hypothetical protein